jgi:hypothetical protein
MSGSGHPEPAFPVNARGRSLAPMPDERSAGKPIDRRPAQEVVDRVVHFVRTRRAEHAHLGMKSFFSMRKRERICTRRRGRRIES